jgi:hypothetical protein
VDPTASSRVYAGLGCSGVSSGGFRVSTDSGATWGVVEPGLCVNALFQAPGNSNYVYAAGRGLSLFMFSADKGSTWAIADLGVSSSLEASSVAVTADGKTAYLGTSGGLYKSTAGF